MIAKAFKLALFIILVVVFLKVLSVLFVPALIFAAIAAVIFFGYYYYKKIDSGSNK